MKNRLKELMDKYKELCTQEPLPTDELSKLSREIDRLEAIYKGFRGNDC